MENPMRVKITGDQTFIDSLRRYASDNSDGFKIEGEQSEPIPERLGFDFGIIVTIITVISGAANIGRAVNEIVKALRESKTPKALIETPSKTEEILSEDDDAKNIAKLSTLMQQPQKG
jgi:Sec-independent protein translocase protein TatA